MVNLLNEYVYLYGGTNNKFIELINEINSIINDKKLFDSEEIIEKCLKEIVIKAYTIIREDNSLIDLMYKLIYSLIVYIDNIAKDDDILYNRMLSLIALKNDMKLQQNLNIRQIDLYLEEVKYIISKKAYLKSDGFTTPKVAECLAKIQYAYQLIGSKKSIRNIFLDFMNIVAESNVCKKFFYELNTEKHLDGDSPGLMFVYYIFFRSEKNKVDLNQKPGEYHRYIIPLMFWKRHRTSYYNMTKEELEKEGYDNYKFVYR